MKNYMAKDIDYFSYNIFKIFQIPIKKKENFFFNCFSAIIHYL